MSAPVRPEPDPPRAADLRSRLSAVRARVQLLLKRSRSPQFSDDDFTGYSEFEARPKQWSNSASLGWSAALVVGAALLTLAGLLGWQSWSQRSAPPVDDRLPFFESTPTPRQPDQPAAGTEVIQGPEGGGDHAAASGPVVPGDAVGPGAGLDGAQGSPAAVSVADVIVHVSGAVDRPGVVTLPQGARVFQAIELVGGAASDADLDRVNLAAPVSDGERIHVPTVGEDIPPLVVQPVSPLPGPEAPELIDVNTAEAADLEDLPGIGPSLAESIVSTRSERGPFRTIDELLEVPGIGPAKLALFRDQVTIS